MVNCYACFGKQQKLVPWTYEPRPLGDNDVEVKITHCGICGSDLHTLDSGWRPTIYPVVVGHEIVGTVVKAGPKVRDLKAGDRVGIGAQASACLNCELCNQGNDNFCPEQVWTYNNTYADGSISYGGYAESIRVSACYAFKIPEELPSNAAAPLLCAGVTVFNPLWRNLKRPGMKVGIVGIGGLGHLAIQFAKGLKAEVYAISRSDSKKADSLKFGAANFVNRKENFSDKISRELDLILITSYGEENDWEKFVECVKIGGKIVVVGLPEHKISLEPFLLMKGVSLEGSLIGSRDTIVKMLKFAADHKIKPQIEEYPMAKVNDALEHFRLGKANYRIVLYN